ncbi:MAG: nicotinamide-nucleotide amidohydrolase family protein [Desulfobacterales bacterium]
MTAKKGQAEQRPIRTISVFGLSESFAREQLAGFYQRFTRLRLGFRAKFPDVRVNLYAGQSDPDALRDSVEDAVRWVRRRLGNHAFSDSGQSMEHVVGILLREKRATLAVAESCTGGLIANLLTDVPGSSDYFLFSAVTYANEAKMKILNVKAETLQRHGAVSEQTAGEMAWGAKQIVDATYGLATSGIAGPDGGTVDKPVGTVCIGLATPSSVTGQRFKFTHNSRKRNKRIFAAAALDMLRKELLNAS